MFVKEDAEKLTLYIVVVKSLSLSASVATKPYLIRNIASPACDFNALRIFT